MLMLEDPAKLEDMNSNLLTLHTMKGHGNVSCTHCRKKGSDLCKPVVVRLSRNHQKMEMLSNAIGVQTRILNPQY